MLTWIRKGTSSFLMTVLMGLLIVSFAVWGIGDVFRFKDSDAIATVGNAKITPAEFTREFQNEINRWKQQFGGEFTAAQAREFGLPQQILQRMINRATFDQAAKKLHLYASDAQVRDLIIENPAFHNSFGEFDRALYENILQYSGMSVTAFEAAARTDIVREQLLATVAGGAHAPASLVDELYVYHGEQRVIDVLRFPASKITTVGAPSEDDLKSYYAANTNQFMAPEYRSLAFVVLSTNSFLTKVDLSEDAIKAYYDQNADQFATPEKRTVEQMVLGSKDAAEKVYNAVKGGESLVAVAKETAGLSATDIQLGDKSEADLATELGAPVAAAAFAVKAGEITAPVEGAFGWHVLQVTAVHPGTSRSYAEAHDEIEQRLRQEKALDQLYDDTNRIEDELAGGASLADIAKPLGLSVVHIPAVAKDGTTPDGTHAAELPNIPGLLDQASATDIGADLDLKEADRETFYLLAVEGITPVAERPFESVKAVVAENWKALEREKHAKAAAEAARDALASGKAIDTVTTAAGVQQAITIARMPLPTATNVTPEIRQTAFDLKSGAVGVAPSADRDGYIVVKVESITPGNPATAGAIMPEFTRGVTLQYGNDVLVAYQAYLQRKLGVKYNEKLFNEVLAQLTERPA